MQNISPEIKNIYWSLFAFFFFFPEVVLVQL